MGADHDGSVGPGPVDQDELPTATDHYITIGLPDAIPEPGADGEHGGRAPPFFR